MPPTISRATLYRMGIVLLLGGLGCLIWPMADWLHQSSFADYRQTLSQPQNHSNGILSLLVAAAVVLAVLWFTPFVPRTYMVRRKWAWQRNASIFLASIAFATSFVFVLAVLISFIHKASLDPPHFLAWRWWDEIMCFAFVACVVLAFYVHKLWFVEPGYPFLEHLEDLRRPDFSLAKLFRLGDEVMAAFDLQIQRRALTVQQHDMLFAMRQDLATRVEQLNGQQ